VVPFDEAVLDAIWNRCRGPRCAAARRETEERLGMQEDGSWAFPAMKPGDATRYPASPLETSPTPPALSPETDSN